MKKRLKNSEGITLVALVITIVILIILAVVAVNAIFGESGLLRYAEDARNYQVNADSADGTLINDATEYIDQIIGGNNNNQEETVDLTGKNIIWIGDSLVRGLNETANNAFPEYFARLTNANCYNFSALGAKIEIDETVTSKNYLMTQVNQAIESTSERPDETVDLIVISAGGNDIFDYDSMKKEIGTVDTGTSDVTSGDTIMTDFEKTIKTIKDNFPNTKILFVKAYNSSQESVEEINYADIKLYWELDYINQLLGTSASSFEEIKDLIIQTLTDGDSDKGIDPQITIMKQYSDQMMGQIQAAASKWGFEFLDIGDYISLEEGTDLQEDYKHISAEGYEKLTPYIVQKAQEMLAN